MLVLVYSASTRRASWRDEMESPNQEAGRRWSNILVIERSLTNETRSAIRSDVFRTGNAIVR